MRSEQQEVSSVRLLYMLGGAAQELDVATQGHAQSCRAVGSAEFEQLGEAVLNRQAGELPYHGRGRVSAFVCLMLLPRTPVTVNIVRPHLVVPPVRRVAAVLDVLVVLKGNVCEDGARASIVKLETCSRAQAE